MKRDDIIFYVVVILVLAVVIMFTYRFMTGCGCAPLPKENIIEPYVPVSGERATRINMAESGCLAVSNHPEYISTVLTKSFSNVDTLPAGKAYQLQSVSKADQQGKKMVQMLSSLVDTNLPIQPPEKRVYFVPSSEAIQTVTKFLLQKFKQMTYANFQPVQITSLLASRDKQGIIYYEITYVMYATAGFGYSQQISFLVMQFNDTQSSPPVTRMAIRKVYVDGFSDNWDQQTPINGVLNVEGVEGFAPYTTTEFLDDGVSLQVDKNSTFETVPCYNNNNLLCRQYPDATVDLQTGGNATGDTRGVFNADNPPMSMTMK